MKGKKITYKNFENYNRIALSLYSKYVLDPLGRLFSIFVINYTAFKPYHITLLSLILSGISAFLFLKRFYFIGAVIFQLSVVFDVVDGYVARINKTGSAFGIFLDYYCDQIRVFINIFVFMVNYYKEGNYAIPVLLGIFLFLNILENWFNKMLWNIENFWRNKKPKFNKCDRFILRLKDFLEKKGLKLLLIHYHERTFLVLFLAPILNRMELFTILAIIFIIVTVNIKILLDVAIIKDKILNNNVAYLSYTTGIKNYIMR